MVDLKFCDECGALLFPKKEVGSEDFVMVCRKCGKITVSNAINRDDYVLTYHFEHLRQERIPVIKTKC